MVVDPHGRSLHHIGVSKHSDGSAEQRGGRKRSAYVTDDPGLRPSCVPGACEDTLEKSSSYSRMRQVPSAVFDWAA